MVKLLFIPEPSLVLGVGNSTSGVKGGVGEEVKVDIDVEVGPLTLLALTGLGARETVLVFLTLSVAGVEAKDETLEGSP